MQTIIDNKKLEQLLITRWAEFLDHKQLLAFTLNNVRDNKDKFKVNEEQALPEKNVQVLLSKFQLVQFGFDLWIDFTVPAENELMVGTLEVFLSNTGSLRLKRALGHRFIKQSPKI